MTDKDGEKAQNTETIKTEEAGNKGVVIIIGIILAVVLGLVLFSNSQKEKSNAAGVTTAQDLSADDGWIKVLRPNTSDFVVMQFVLQALPQCNYFHFQTMMEGRAMGIRCFEKSDREKPDYYYVLSGTSEFLGPYDDEETMRERAEELMASLRAQAASETQTETQEDMPAADEETAPAE